MGFVQCVAECRVYADDFQIATGGHNRELIVLVWFGAIYRARDGEKVLLMDVDFPDEWPSFRNEFRRGGLEDGGGNFATGGKEQPAASRRAYGVCRRTRRSRIPHLGGQR